MFLAWSRWRGHGFRLDFQALVLYDSSPMATPLRTRNFFLNDRHFVAGAFWRARRGGFLILPAFWFEWGKEPSLEVRLHRFSAGWGFWRAQFDLGIWNKIPLAGPVDWGRLGIDEYLKWSRKTFKQQWQRIDVERLFRTDPAWRHLVMAGTAHNHYVRVIMARAMLKAGEGATASLGANDSLASALTEPGAATSQGPSWAGKPSEKESRSLMEELDQLGEKLRKRTDEKDDEE